MCRQHNKTIHHIKIFNDDIFYDHYDPVEGKKNSKAVVFMHGLPGAVTKNNDCAEYCSSEFGVDSFVYHYRGLGVSKGSFSFEESADEVKKFISYLECTYRFTNIVLVSHSYSSMTCLPVLRDTKSVSKAVLLAPVIKMLSEAGVKDLLLKVDEMLVDSGKINVKACLGQYQEFISKNNPVNVIKSLVESKNVIVVVPEYDSVIEPSIAISEKGIFNKVIKLKDDHWFSNRQQLFNLLKEVV